MDTETIITIVAAIAVPAAIALLLINRGNKQKLRDAEAAVQADKEELQRLRTELEQQRREYTQTREENAKLTAEKNAAERSLQQREEKLQQDMNSMRHEFRSISQEIFSKNTEQSQKDIQKILQPLKEKLTSFQDNMQQSFTRQTAEQASLKTQIENIVNTGKTLQDQTNNLVHALRADVRVQGRWGEVMLERIVQAAGLREGEEYTTQGKDMKLRYDHGSTMKPDLVIHLPDNRNIVIDAKVSLKSYEQYVNAQTEDEQTRHLDDFTLSIRNHIEGLAGRQYHQAVNNSPDFTLLFTPIEGAFTLLMQTRNELQEQAWQDHIAIVSPTTLWPILVTVQSLWRIERQNRNARQIAEEGGKLYDKIVAFTEDMDKLGRQINTVSSTYNEAKNKLSTGRGNILKRTDDLKQLGARTTKQLDHQTEEE